MRLEIALIPKTTWGNNVRSAVTQTEWDKIRKKTYQRDNYRCVICGDGRKIHCHEEWQYFENKSSNIQRLVRLRTVCETCHHVIHFGRSELLCQQGKLDKEKLMAHFCKVNKCDEATFHAHRDDVFVEWARKSLIEWTVDIKRIYE